jgi:Tol biopolymer transport system component
MTRLTMVPMHPVRIASSALVVFLAACQAPPTPVPLVLSPTSSPSSSGMATASRTASPTSTEYRTPTAGRTLVPTAVKTKAPSRTPTANVLKGLGKIAFFHDGGLYTMRADGSERTLVLEFDGLSQGVSWSPDGKQLVYAADWQIGIANVNGSGYSKISDNSGCDGEPDWSPDGEWIVFSSDRSMRPHPNGPFYTTDLYLMRPDGSDLRNLSPELPINSGSPEFSPNGRWIAFWYGGPLYLMDPASGAMNSLVSEGDCDLFNPAWSPDGTRIAYEKYCSGRSQIFIIPVEDPKAKTALTQAPSGKNFGASFPTWSPDGQFIAYQKDYEICIHSLKTGLIQCLTAGEEPDWSWATE